MDISSWLKGLAGVVAGAALVCNLPTRLWMSTERATLPYLEDCSLHTVDESQRLFKVMSFFRPNIYHAFAVISECLTHKRHQGENQKVTGKPGKNK